MAIAAFDWAEENGIPAFYIDTINKKIQFYTNKDWTSFELPDLLDFKSLLTLYQYEIIQLKEHQIEDTVKIALKNICKIITSPGGGRLIRILNGCANSANFNHTLNVHLRYMTSSIRELLTQIKLADKLVYHDNEITFNNKESREWCKGLWLEDYV